MSIRSPADEPTVHAAAMLARDPLSLGIDVGSTTVKAVLVRRSDGRVIRSAYERHHGELRSATRALLGAMGPDETSVSPVLTGSGARALAAVLDAPVVHEVTAVAAAVQQRHPGARTIVELGGQDAKLVRLEHDSHGRLTNVHAGMNDRCAAGTGVTLDRVLGRLGVSPDQARFVRYDPARVRALSSKCGVFAETDAVNLARAGVPVHDLVASLADAIVVGNLAVLARGAPLESSFVLLGGPIRFLPVLAGAWRHHLRGPTGEALVVVPDQALLYAAIGATRVADDEGTSSGLGTSLGAMREALGAPARFDRTRCDAPLAREASDVATFAGWARAHTPAWRPPPSDFAGLSVGIDAGSTVSKAVALDADGQPIARARRPSRDPIADARALIAELETSLRARGIEPRFDRIGVTGYGAALVAPVIGADANVLETLAHAASARIVAPDVEVVCDVGGQDIKILGLESDGSIRDFRISSQCAAGIGMVLEATAREFDIPLDRFADVAFSARRAPWFGERCVVFLDSDRVGFQRHGFGRDEILAGLSRALARVVWQHIEHDGAVGHRGRTLVLQGGVQRNLAALKAQVDLLAENAPGVRVLVHPFPDDAGALGAALLARQVATRDEGHRARTSLRTVVARSDESTRCGLCTNHCARTEITLVRDDGARESVVAGNACEAGATAEPASIAARAIPRKRRHDVPNLLADEARLLFARSGASGGPHDVRPRVMAHRMRIGIPRTLSMYRSAPFYRAYLEQLGVRPRDVVFSPPTDAALWRDGSHHGATDPCFPVKVTLAHVSHLLTNVHDAGRPLDAIVVPRTTHAATPVKHALDCASCPVVAAAPAMVRAAFASGDDALARRGIHLVDGAVDLADHERLRAQMHTSFGGLLEATRAESDEAVARGLAAMRALDVQLQSRAASVLDALDGHSSRGAVLVIARPYHADPGICHRVGEELQSLGYPVLTIRSLPREPERLTRLFGADVASGLIEDPFDIRDLLPESDNSGASERLWAARFAASHGRLGVLDLSSFKCAQDPPTYASMRALFDRAGTIRCNLHDLDETRPITSLRLRLKTFAHALGEKGLHAWSSSAA